MMRTFKTLLALLSALLIIGCASGSGQYGSSDPAAQSSAKAHTELGAAYYQQSKLEIALEEFTLATKADPNYALAYNGLGLVYAALGEDAKADTNFKRALQLDTNSSETHNNYGSFLCARKRYDESIHHFLQAVKNPLYGTPSIAYANAGICSIRKNDPKGAEPYLQKALQVDPLMHPAAYYLADIQFKRGDVPSAQKTLQNALVSNPGPEILWLGIRIERILGNKDNEASYALQLRQKFPESQQTKLLLSGQ